MINNSFKNAALKILSEAGKSLNYREITNIAIDKGIIKSNGKTPWATMNAQLSMDIINEGEYSQFIRTDPGFFALRNLVIKTSDITSTRNISGKARIVLHQVTNSLNSIQKGNIAEARVTELITLYGDEGLSCYRPVTDDEGIDIIVKKRGQLDAFYIQVKSTFGYGLNDRGFVSTVDESSVIEKSRLLMVFVYFDLSKGDLFDQVFCIPAPDFLRLTKNEKNNTTKRVFTVGLRTPDQSKYAEFMIEKRELANRILELMKRI